MRRSAPTTSSSCMTRPPRAWPRPSRRRAPRSSGAATPGPRARARRPTTPGPSWTATWRTWTSSSSPVPSTARPTSRPSAARSWPPSIDADSPKNRVLDLDEAWSVARLSGIFTGEPPFEAVPFMRHDGRADAFRGLADDPVLAGGPVPHHLLKNNNRLRHLQFLSVLYSGEHLH